MKDIQNKPVDLRSDTITLPTPEMRKAMFEAEVGDDVFGEDPTVNLLEAKAADRTGKEAALFTTSGTQSNLIAVLTHTQHGNEIILGDQSHIFLNEVGGAAAIGGLVMHTLPNASTGRLELREVERAIRGTNIHYPVTALICIENTHNRCGGSILSQDYTNSLCDLAKKHNLKVHLDGARIFNAAVALNIPVHKLTEQVDSVSFCLSKGLSAPVGSVLCGKHEFINRARKIRKMLGGGMRQAGILAAAGIVALDTMVDRLAEDHFNAKRLANGLAQIKGININPNEVTTNIVIFQLSATLSVEEFGDKLEKSGIKILPFGSNYLRAVTNRMVSTADIDQALLQIEAVCRKLSKSK
jgi:threonine aldolase